MHDLTFAFMIAWILTYVGGTSHSLLIIDGGQSLVSPVADAFIQKQHDNKDDGCKARAGGLIYELTLFTWYIEHSCYGNVVQP